MHSVIFSDNEWGEKCRNMFVSSDTFSGRPLLTSLAKCFALRNIVVYRSLSITALTNRPLRQRREKLIKKRGEKKRERKKRKKEKKARAFSP